MQIVFLFLIRMQDVSNTARCVYTENVSCGLDAAPFTVTRGIRLSF